MNAKKRKRKNAKAEKRKMQKRSNAKERNTQRILKTKPQNAKT